MAITAGFLLFVATPRYGSTATFIVRSIDAQAPLQVGQNIAGGTNSTIANDETFAVNAFLKSREVVALLVKNHNLRAVLSRSRGDFVFGYPTFWLPDNNEFLYWRFLWMVKAEVDPVTMFSTIEVNAFTPHDAQKIAQAMVGYAEAMVNRLNEHDYSDEMMVANQFVAQAKSEFDAAEAELTHFRNTSVSVDPSLVAQSELNVIQAISTELAQSEASIKQQLSLTPVSPTLSGLRAHAQAYRDEIERLNRDIAGAPGSEATKLETYDLLKLRHDLAVQDLTEATANKEQARQDVENQHLFIELITQPSLSLDWARYPRIAWDLGWLLAICLALFQVLRRLRDCAAEHLS